MLTPGIHVAPSLSSGLYLKVTFSVRYPLANVSFPLSLLYLFLLDIITISHNMYFAYASCLSLSPLLECKLHDDSLPSPKTVPGLVGAQ